VAYHAIIVRFVNPLNTCLMYGCGYHYGYEMEVFTCVNIFTNYEDFFHMGRCIHQLQFMEQ
jgi:hypothetical protein